MSGHRELHVRVQGIRDMRVVGKVNEPQDVYCIVSLGDVRHRTRLIEDTLSPDWNEEFVFDAAALTGTTSAAVTALASAAATASRDAVIKFEVFSQGVFSDELLFCAYLDVPHTVDQQSSTPSQTTAVSRRASDSSGGNDPSLGATSHAAAAAAGTIGTPGFSSASHGYKLPLLAAQAGSSSRFPGSSGSSYSSRHQRSLQYQQRVKPDKKLRGWEGGVLGVEVWWVQQPTLSNAGTPPRVISFVHDAGDHHLLPSSSHSSSSSQWEEPALAFVRLVVSQIRLGSAAAAAALQGGSSGSSSCLQQSKAIVLRLRSLLRGDAAAAEEEEATAQEHHRHQRLSRSDGFKSVRVRDSHQNIVQAVGSSGHWHLETPESVDQDQDQDHDGDQLSVDLASDSTSSGHDRTSEPGSSHLKLGGKLRSSHQEVPGLGHEQLRGVFRRSSEDGGLTGDEQTATEEDDEIDDDVVTLLTDLAESTCSQPQLQQQQRKSSSAVKARRAQKKAIRRQQDQQLYLTVRIRLGDQKYKALRPVPLLPDGSAEVRQAAVFAVTRPLQSHDVVYELALGLGPRGAPLLVLLFQYSLLHLLRRSPCHPVTWQQWREVTRCTVSGLQVPLPCLPHSYLDLSAFLADADCRAGMYSVPPVAAAALAAAEADDAAAAAALGLGTAAAAHDVEHSGPLQGQESLYSVGSESVYAGDAGQHPGHYPASISRKDSIGSSSSTVTSTTTATSSSRVRGVLRRRAAAAEADKQHQQADQAAVAAAREPLAAAVVAAARGGGLSHLQAKIKDRAADRVGQVLIRVEEGFNHALDRLPSRVAQQVKDNSFIKRVFPRRRKTNVYSLGQLRVPTFVQRHDTAAAAAASSSAINNIPESSGSSSSSSRSSSSSTTDGGSTNIRSSGAGEHHTKATAAAAAASPRPPLSSHPNITTAGSSDTRPLGVLQITIQSITLRTNSSSSSLQLLMRCGPHWLQLQQQAIPITFYNATSSSSSSGGGSNIDGSSNAAISGSQIAPVQVLLPVFSSSSLVTVVIHKRGSAVGRCVFKLYGLLPLLLRQHTKSLTLYSDKRGGGGQRLISGSLLLHLTARPPSGYSRPCATVRLAYSYLITPHTLEMHTSGVLSSISRDERDDAAGEVIAEWLTSAEQQGKHVLPANLVNQLVSTGRGRLSGARMRGHVRRFKAVLLDWLPRRVDPLAFYHWRHPWQNVLVLWVISHVCLWPSQWLFGMTLLVTLTLLRRIAIQIRRGVLGFELEQLPPDMAAAAGVPGQQQQPPGDVNHTDTSLATRSANPEEILGDLHHFRSSAAQLTDKIRYKEAADRLKAKLTHKTQALRSHHHHHPSSVSTSSSTTPLPITSFPKTLDEFRDQLESGSLSLDSVDVEALAEQLLSVHGLIRLARQHSSSIWEYGLVLQNILDDVAGFAEGLYAMLTAQDPLAALLFCCITMTSATFCYKFGVGAGVFVVICVLLRPPLLRGVPGLFGWKALLANLPARTVEELAW